MNKSMKRLCALTLGALTTLATVLPAVGCKEENGGGGTEDSYEKVYRNTETDALTFSIAQLDGNFNPFFATSATDVTIAAQTQISMMTTDKEGNPKCGEDVPTVALNYKQTMKTESGAVTNDGNQAATTEYEFLIKNGIKISVSSRGVGDVVNGVVTDYELITYDIVPNPSDFNATMNGVCESSILNEGIVQDKYYLH